MRSIYVSEAGIEGPGARVRRSASDGRGVEVKEL